MKDSRKGFGEMRCAFAVLLVLWAGCSAGRVANKEGVLPAKRHARDIEQDYYPLQIGNTWTYKVNTLGELTEQTITVDKRDGKFFHLTGGGGGLVYRDGYGIRDKNRYLLRFPVELGATWESILSPDSVEYYEITGVGKRVETPAGTFESCVEVTSKHAIDEKQVLVNKMVFAPGVGIVLVRTELHREGKRPIPQVELQLAKYKVMPSKLPDVLKQE